MAANLVITVSVEEGMRDDVRVTLQSELRRLGLNAEITSMFGEFDLLVKVPNLGDRDTGKVRRLLDGTNGITGYHSSVEVT